MLTLQIIATVFLGLGILKSIIKYVCDCEETTLGYIIGYFYLKYSLLLLFG